MSRVEKAMGVTPPDGRTSYMRYAVDSHDGRWTHEIVVGPSVFAARRTRHGAAESAYSFGRDVRGTWLRIGEGEALAVDAAWEEEARTQAAIFGLSFTRPGQSDELEYMGKWGRRWEFAFRPSGGRTLTFGVDRASNIPKAFDAVDDFGRLVQCKSLKWKRVGERSVLARARCSSVDRFGDAPNLARSRFRLAAAEPIDPERAPDWATRPAARRLSRALDEPLSLPIADPRRITVPVRFGDHPPVNLILDSGAFHTVLSSEAAERLGVIPTGEPPLFTKPPWLADTNLWVGVVGRMQVGGAELHGERVLVAENRRTLGADAGLLGATFFERFIVEVDSPSGALRLLPREGYRPEAGATLLQMPDSGEASIKGEVKGVARGLVILDTGMADDIVVHHWMMKIQNPRERGSDAFLGGGRDALHSPDYFSKVRGVRLGPFHLPAMDAIGRDREREKVGGGIAVVGMGLMRYFKLAFDFKGRLLYAWPGDGYTALMRAGIDIEDGPGGAVLDRVIDESPAARAGLRRGDIITAVAGRKPRDYKEARSAVAGHPSSTLRMDILRNGWKKAITLQLNEPPEPDAP